MPELDGKKYKYDKEGKKQFAKDLVKKLKKKRKKRKMSGDSNNNPMHALSQE